jgi:hypothetical protein
MKIQFSIERNTEILWTVIRLSTIKTLPMLALRGKRNGSILWALSSL